MVFLLSFGSAVFAAIFNVASKRCVSGKEWSPFPFTLSYSVVTGLLSLMCLPFLPGPSGTWQGPVFTCLGLLLGHTLLSMALARGDASTITPLLGLKSIFVPVVAVIFTDEKVGPMLWIAAALCVAGIYLLNASDGKSDWRGQLWNVGVALMLGCTLSYALADNWIRVQMAEWNVLRFFCVSQAFFGGLCAVILAFGMTPRRAGAPLLVSPKPLPLQPLVAAAVASWVSQLMLWVAFGLADATTLPVIVQSSRGLLTILLILLLARMGRASIAGEYRSRRVYVQRLAGASLMAAALIVAIGG